MRGHLGGALVLAVVAAAVGLALYGRAAERTVDQVELHERSVVGGAGEGQEPGEALAFSADETRTLPVGESASEADGLLELRVTARGRPAGRAQVRLYRRGGRVPETGRVDWRMAAAGAPGNDGRLLMPARAGAYLVVARAEGFAPTWRELVHPLDGNRTPVHLKLEEAVSLSGLTVAQGTGAPLSRAELTLTPHVSAWEQETRADAPAEEQVTVTSDAAGRFHVEGLAPGLYTVEGRAPGVSFTETWNLRVPSASEPLLLALPRSTRGEQLQAPRQPASKELRCGT
ncbi:carboxypeptidase-like regulatory domain-containing protein [Hyalangium rubrum]|uniref:Carboxypeptidase-like regulatory domain-containing protein n=1 Tax=Hyalangium rubrum TaxID=3103134 RepID=A0ABU5H269_9BACT|nr:carboxypeptidase-like regulatory domain-containing protein [Hyalangium sp. s54d21]MDY7227552.1 carboxypeptidase-like regulatory domain-containing protein [Hyalangium sp. s54d21]